MSVFVVDLRARWVALVWACALGCANAGSGKTSAPPAPSSSEGPPGPETPAAAFIAPRIRRLTNAEYDATVQSLLGTQQAPAQEFVPDARLYKYGKFERNDAQIVEPTLARQLQKAAASLAAEYVATTLRLALPCLSQADEACARQFFESFLPRAYRRPLAETELEDLLSLVVLPAIPRDGFNAAIQLGIEATLQSTGFLYHTELGSDAVASGPVTLTNAETAQAMAYLLTGAPADADLSRADLSTAESRETQARRLWRATGAKLQVRRLVKQWVDIDQVGDTAKDKGKFPDYQPHGLDDESDAFIDEVVFARGGGYRLLMGADFTVGRSELAAFYGAPPPSSEPGIIDLRGVPRRGILNLGAFLANYATPELPSPVKRGARFLTQALCIDPGDPNELMLSITFPQPSAAKTTRQRFEEHAQGSCAGCHVMIDSVGFAFEHFNAVGAWEAAEDGNPALPIDSATTLELPAEIPFAGQPITDSAELAALASESEAGRRCFARNLARFTTATYGASIEQGFIEEADRLAAAGEDSVQELLVAFIRSDYFVQRDPKEAAP